MVIIDYALVVMLIWALATCSLILGGCISACVLRLGSQGSRAQQLFVYGPYLRQQKSEIYLD